MGAMNNYKLLIEDRARVAKITRSLVINRLTYLSSVGRSVMNKAHGGDYGWSNKETFFLGESLDQLIRLGTPKLIRLEEDAVILEHPKYTAQNPNRTLSIPRRWLHMSDRDFAKFVRKLLKDRRAYEKRIALAHAEMDLKKALKDLEDQRLEVTRLENLVEASKAAKAQDSA